MKKYIYGMLKYMVRFYYILYWSIWKTNIQNYLVLSSMKYWLSSLAREALSSVQFSHSTMCDSLQPHESQHARPPCPSPTSGVQSNSCPLSQWCHPAISSSVVPFSSCPWPKYWRLSFSVTPSNEHPGLISFRMDWLDLLAVQGISRVFSSTTVQKH